MTSPAARLLIAPIRFYQRFVTPYTPATCRYYPTCSAYAVTALRSRGAMVGSGLTIWRLLRCNPWSNGGIDHVSVRGGSGPEHSGPGHAGTERAGTGHSGTERSGTEHAGTGTLRTGESEFGERGAIPQSSSTALTYDRTDGADGSSAVTDCSDDCLTDAPPSVAGAPMIGRSAA